MTRDEPALIRYFKLKQQTKNENLARFHEETRKNTFLGEKIIQHNIIFDMDCFSNMTFLNSYLEKWKRNLCFS